ncbi:hypothetical protein [Dokdonella koreensis]|uniref:hypothetical protein n=1 Tax=Dokdonella koreensis TaxID=323415 RepID=UPI001CC00A8F|nr:hypothetical protein [Dokdonella koreensis]
MTTSWIPVVNANKDLFVRREVRGTSVRVAPSPHDVPTCLRTVREEGDRKVILEVRYLDEEATIRRSVSEKVEAHVGRNSGRLHRLSVDLNRSPVKVAAIQEFEKALHKVQACVKHGLNVSNAEIIEKAVGLTKELDDL